MEVNLAPGMVSEPGGDFGGAVRADRLEEQMDQLLRRGVLVWQGQQFAELARAVLQQENAADPAILDPKAGQQVNRAVAQVLEFSASRSAISRSVGSKLLKLGTGGTADDGGANG